MPISDGVSCPHLKEFWKEAVDQICEITGYSVPLQPEVIFLSYWPDKAIPNSSKKLIFTLITAAKTAVDLKWKSNFPPKLSLWYC